MKAQLITTDSRIIDVVPKNGVYFELKELQTYVGGYIERVVCPDDREMYINEEGKLQGLNINVKATEISGLHPHDVICGNAIVGPMELFRSPEELKDFV